MVNSSHPVTPPAIRKQRDSNIELYRIIVMLLIVMHHYVVNSGLHDVMSQQPTSLKSLYLYTIGAWGKTGINCFVMITGYYMCKSHITMRKFLKLFLQVLFYSVIITAIFIAAGYEPYSITHMIREVNPVGSISTGFTSCYLMFFLLIPFMNVLIRNMSQRQHLRLVTVLLFIYTILGSIPKIQVIMNYVSWFCVLYFIASYIRLYDFPYKNNVKFWGWSTLCLVLLAIASVVSISFLAELLGKGTDKVYFFMSDSNKPFPVLIGITSFLFFKEAKVPQSKFVNTVAASTFGVLLIHANSDTMRHWLWRTICNNAGMYDSNLIYFHAIAIPIIVFAVCIVIDHIRIKTIETPSINFFLPYAEKLKAALLNIEDKVIIR